MEPVGVHLKGNDSFLPIDEKPSLKVKFNWRLPNLDLLGMQEIALDNMSSDASMMHERLAYRLFREAGLPAARANHATVSINGDDRGLYTLVENEDDEFLGLRYADPSGSMWEFADVEFQDIFIDWFEIETGSDDRTALRAISGAMLALDRYQAASPYVDWRQFVDFTAACAVVGQYDSYPWRSPGDDVHLYFDPADGKMEIIPHGLDETFVRDTRDVFDAPGLLMQACLADPGCADDYRASLWDLQGVAESFDLHAFAQRVQHEIQPFVEADPRRPYSRTEVHTAQDDTLSFIDHRHDELVNQIGRP
jgi:hypothetical protein